MKVIEAANQNEPKSARKMASMIKRETYPVETTQSNDSCAARTQGEGKGFRTSQRGGLQ
jgi:hypothetical protein